LLFLTLPPASMPGLRVQPGDPRIFDPLPPRNAEC